MSDVQQTNDQPDDQQNDQRNDQPQNASNAPSGTSPSNKAFVAGMQPGQTFADFKENLIRALREQGFFDQAAKNAAAKNAAAKNDAEQNDAGQRDGE